MLTKKTPETIKANLKVKSQGVTNSLLLTYHNRTPEQYKAFVENPENFQVPESVDPEKGISHINANLVLFLVVVQFVQVLLLSLGVLAFFLVFGSLTMGLPVQYAWTQMDEGTIHALPYLSQVSVPLLKVSLFLGSFSALYLTVSTVTDETYREQFFGLVIRELERAVGLRAVYLTLRERQSPTPRGTQPQEPRPPA